jgi:hypothetical protein
LNKEEDAMKKRKNHKARNQAILSQLAGMLDRSLARYLSHAHPWCRQPYLLLAAVTRKLSYDHERFAGAIVQLLHGRGENVNSHTFPMEFTYYNDLSLEYLAPKVLDEQRRLIALATAVAGNLAQDGDYEAHRLIEDLLATSREYAAILEELLAPHRLAPPTPRERAAADNSPSAPQRISPSVARAAETQVAA